jgi:hypothetical protein
VYFSSPTTIAQEKTAQGAGHSRPGVVAALRIFVAGFFQSANAKKTLTTATLAVIL